ncbi:hypothetical protein [Proteiniborus sp. MB09-C3]|uniref:hypothetical protein n=1 Tax=Proteiniborus sp. MB09-C3 TaxID=3050072 RepID=UPI00255286F9|nr:hypothetical protein [Proteiniborus sp. MB09-C3]WIV12486.1 hypothetical protein QO263_01795 [Proteiniborus sp. MB09-C3]
MDIKAKESIRTESLETNRLKTIINIINREKVKVSIKKISEMVLIIMTIILAADLISMIVYCIFNGFPA